MNSKRLIGVPVSNLFEKIISLMSCKFCNNSSPPYMNNVFKLAGHPSTIIRASLLKLNQPLGKSNQCHKSILYIAPIIWNNLSNFL